MTQRISGILLTFKQPMREDDVEYLLVFLRQCNDVSDARAVDTEPSAEYLAQARRDREWMEKLGDVQDAMLRIGKYRGQS